MEYKNILIIKMSSLGDIIHTLPSVAVLRKSFPNARLTWLVHPQFGAFVPDPPIIDEVIYFDKVKFKKMSLAEKWSYFWQIYKDEPCRKVVLFLADAGLASQ